MSWFARTESSIVAGANDGAGAELVVCVREIVLRDLSRNSMMDYSKIMIQEALSRLLEAVQDRYVY